MPLSQALRFVTQLGKFVNKIAEVTSDYLVHLITLSVYLF